MNITRRLTCVATLVAAVALLSQVSPLMAHDEGGNRPRRLHVKKSCSEYFGNAGEFCTITSSNLGRIRVHSTVTYDQAAGIPAFGLDSNVVLDAGNGDRAMGRCTLDFGTLKGLCTFSDGTGRLAGFHARVEVSNVGGTDWAWDGTSASTTIDDDAERSPTAGLLEGSPASHRARAFNSSSQRSTTMTLAGVAFGSSPISVLMIRNRPSAVSS